MVRILTLLLAVVLSPVAKTSADNRKLPLTILVDLIEINHVYDETGRHRFDQMILWEWSPDYRRFHVVGWWTLNQDVNYTINGNTAQLRELVADGVVARSARTYLGKAKRETWTTRDPEVTSRAVFGEQHRRGL